MPRSTFSHLWFAWTMLANLLVTALIWGPTMLSLRARPSARTFSRFMRGYARAVFALCGFRVVSSREAPADRAVVYVANHQAMLDIPALTLGIDQPFVFVARGGLRRVPFIGSVLQRSGCVFLDRGVPGAGERAIEESAARLAAGESVLFFPEGTRTFGDRLLPFRRGAFRLAMRAGVPVVPVAIDGAHRLLNEQSRTARPGRLTLRVGAPMEARGGESEQDWADRARDEVARLLARADPGVTAR